MQDQGLARNFIMDAASKELKEGTFERQRQEGFRVDKSYLHIADEKRKQDQACDANKSSVENLPYESTRNQILSERTVTRKNGPASSHKTAAKIRHQYDTNTTDQNEEMSAVK